MTTWHDTICCDRQARTQPKGPHARVPQPQAPRTYTPPAVKREFVVLDEARRRLGESEYCLDRLVVCDYHEGILTLRGRVPSFYLKQLAQDALKGVEGVEGIINHVEVG